MNRRTLYLVACAAPPVRHVSVGICAAQAAGWDVCLILTPAAYRWAVEDAEGEIEKLRELTGHPVRHSFELPSQPDELPAPDAILVAPATFNTLNKWAAGTADTLALGLITEAIGLGKPIVALPGFNTAQARHPAFERNIETLREAGVNVLLGEGKYVPRPPRQGWPHEFPWQIALDALPTGE
ncbi:flavoprotein [Streptomyces chrestomyceticus]|uniref:flavoprotein n=1 Tax=Streptomyces chrestomyceticus TaxID=68185 RepID=UPI001FCFC6F5|nr:flavoprotein [Streptomyces chrestomyceticus]